MSSGRARADLPCTWPGCDAARLVHPSGRARPRCQAHARQDSREAARRERATLEGREARNGAQRRWLAKPGNRDAIRAASREAHRRTGYRASKAAQLRRREAMAARTWARTEPWPTTCAVCGQAIDPERRHPDPLAQVLDHEPPIAWVRDHDDYDGPLVLRPTHAACNASKGKQPDWCLTFERLEGVRLEP